MASLGQKLLRRRKNKKASLGKKRKTANRNKGTTPKFAIHEDKAETK